MEVPRFRRLVLTPGPQFDDTPSPAMQNVEFKCELRDLELARTICAGLGASRVAVLEQRDTYFRVFSGRLKRRETRGEPREWIIYHRPDRVSNKVSTFTIYSEEEAIERFGNRPMPEWVVVEKRRDLWILDEVRIHLDEVKGLGRFLEFEALVTRKRHLGEAQRLVTSLRREFAPILGEPIAVSYCDLMSQKKHFDLSGAHPGSESGSE